MLVGGGIVATVMSNLGLERYLGSLGLTLERTQVGDAMCWKPCAPRVSMSAASSQAHIILSDFTTTGDGLVAALQLLAVLKQADRSVSEICARFTRFRSCCEA